MIDKTHNQWQDALQISQTLAIIAIYSKILLPVFYLAALITVWKEVHQTANLKPLPNKP